MDWAVLAKREAARVAISWMGFACHMPNVFYWAQ
jgi:hypothetical protein